MVEERKDEIGKEFLLKEEICMEELKKLEIQEINFLIYTAQYFRDNKKYEEIDFNKKIKIFMDLLIDKIKESNELYIAYDKSTNYPYIDSFGKAWLFSKEEFAKNAEDYFSKQLIMLDMKKITSEEIMNVFYNCHLLGIEKLTVDNGQYYVDINRDDILPPPDLSDVPEINIPVTNPKLQNAMVRFFQRLYSKNNYEGKERDLQKLEDKMLDEVIDAKYLLPMQLKGVDAEEQKKEGEVKLNKGAIMEFAALADNNNEEWAAAFTDWVEFEKAYDKNIWKGNIVTYDDLLFISKEMKGIVINYRGIPLRLSDKNKKIIEEYRKNRNNKDITVKEEVMEKGTEIILGEPKEYPSEMIEAIKKYMKKEKSITKAYLRLMLKDNIQSYLIIVDFNGNKDAVFRGIANVAVNHSNGMFVDIVDANEFKDNIKDIEPFYKKKRFGLFS
ncbi:enhanced serine sensitivity protein SseB [Clostridium baratii]|uniref:enhanced serine sensitivity protein SseB n=1 Tax=Clostridium baratii TaxID=1561 RepID=UPI002A753902|nr:enhanced serine sensitivity protein SseB C-terminal domain-containing protein [Clostridium baratii]MDY3207215.1 enhanced serine sensitivity protein SseB C-terminal domain-containing protein [Clostridium baratii]